jgi:pilus assembly protein Flp/PilA
MAQQLLGSVRVCLLSTLKEFVMSKFISAVKAFVADEEGVTALEYGLIAALIAAAIVTSVQGLGDAVIGIFDSIAGEMEKATPTAG